MIQKKMCAFAPVMMVSFLAAFCATACSDMSLPSFEPPKANIAVADLTLDYATLSFVLIEGEDVTWQLNATISPENATNKTITWGNAD
jgi:hypothetical protein